MHYMWALSMDEVMQYSRHFINEQKWERAKEILEYGVSCGNIPAKFKLARLLKNTLALEMSQEKRYRSAEKLFCEILNDLDVSDRVTAKVSLELAELYAFEKRPIGQFAMLLQARRAGAEIEDRVLLECKKKMAEIDIHAIGCKDALALGRELALLPDTPRITEFFLSEACLAKDQIISGMAELQLADLYESLGNSKEASKHFKAARVVYPEYLSKAALRK